MRLTEVRVALRNEGKLKAFVAVTIEDAFVIRGLKVIEGNSGLFVAMPSRKRPDGTHQDIAHPINRRTREELELAVFEAYKRQRAGLGDPDVDGDGFSPSYGIA